MKCKHIFVLFLVFSALVGSAQELPVTMEASAKGEELPTVWLPPFDVKLNKRAYKRYIKKYNRLTRYVRKVYPYAVLAEDIIEGFESQLDTVQSERRKKHITRLAEDELKAEFEDELKKLTFTQGRILIKLIDRQTGKTTYSLIETLRGKFSAFMWQGVARLFGANLKSGYDPEEDMMIEHIISQIESGVIPVETIKRKTKKRYHTVEIGNS